MLVYVDSGIVIDRILAQSSSLLASTAGLRVATSALCLVEIARRIRREDDTADVWAVAQQALAGVDVVAITPQTLATAARLPVRHLKSLDAIHVASALITRCDVVLTRDRQMARACEELGLAVA